MTMVKARFATMVTTMVMTIVMITVMTMITTKSTTMVIWPNLTSNLSLSESEGFRCK